MTKSAWVFWKRICGLISVVALFVLMGYGAAAQSMMPLPPHNSVYTGSSRGFWFTAPTSFFIVGVRVPPEAGVNPQSVFLVRFAPGVPPPAYSASTTNYTILGNWTNVPGTSVIPTGNILVNAGDMIGILGVRCLPPGSPSNSYGATAPVSSIFGIPVTIRRLLYQGNSATTVPGPLSTENSSIARVEIYYEPPCQFPPNIATMNIVDAGGTPKAFAEIPSTVFGQYTLNYPAGATDFTATVTFEKVGVATPTIPTSKYVVVLHDQKLAGATLSNMQQIDLPSTLEPGYYSISTTITSQNSCSNYADFTLPKATLMLVYPGTVPCVVWPGDVNNDGIVNYGDRKSLNSYIYDANQRSTWLVGPARFMINPGPLSFLAWTPQASVPWNTTNGCYMDADGNGLVNNFDYVAIKLNWMRAHGTVKDAPDAAASFDMLQNFPNPFNPSTKIAYSVPEPSLVRLVVVDMMGRTVATLVDGTVDAGSHDVTFDAANLTSGQYVATVTMTGTASGQTYTKSIKMSLTK